jgi:heparanase
VSARFCVCRAALLCCAVRCGAVLCCGANRASAPTTTCKSYSPPSLPASSSSSPKRDSAAFKELSPFVWRLGGSLQDNIVYEEPDNPAVACPPITDDASKQWGFTGGCLTRQRWHQIAAFAKDHGAKLVFGLSGLRGRTQVEGKQWTGEWDPSNARALLNYTKSAGLPVYAWELGNELGGWNGIQAQLTAEEVAGDFNALRQMVDEVYGEEAEAGAEKPMVVGPDTGLDDEWFAAFLTKARGSLDAVAVHMYALGAGVDPALQDKVMQPAHMETAKETAAGLAEVVQSLLAGSLPGGATPQLWMGEDGGAYNSGQNGTSNRYMAGFWSLNELGLFARAGFSTYCRQTLLGGNYGLLDHVTLKPNPDFFNYLLFKRLMGPTVLDLQSSSPDVTAYAHCTAKGAPGAKPGAVSLLLVNFQADADAQVSALRLDGQDLLGGSGAVRHEYLLAPGTAGVLNSTVSSLNGKPLTVSAKGAYPKLEPKEVADGAANPLVLPKTSYGFVVLPDAGVEACK